MTREQRVATQLLGRFGGQSGHGADTPNRTFVTHFDISAGSRCCGAQ